MYAMANDGYTFKRTNLFVPNELYRKMRTFNEYKFTHVINLLMAFVLFSFVIMINIWFVRIYSPHTSVCSDASCSISKEKKPTNIRRFQLGIQKCHLIMGGFLSMLYYIFRAKIFLLYFFRMQCND